jgi:DNA-binding CsgD family transcriptional regulator
MNTARTKSSIYWIIGGTLAFNLVFLIKDLSDDVRENSGLFHIIPEIIIALGTVSIAVLALRLYLGQRQKSEGLEIRLVELEKISLDWQARTKVYSEGLSIEIDRQLSAWDLSPAEKEIALLMLKGLSNKEISDVRSTSEQTIKQQSSAIYRKSGLTNRAELSAYFLEDLLFPQSKPQKDQQSH